MEGILERVVVAEKRDRTLEWYKLFWIFVLGGVAGFIIETIWCRFDFGEFSSRTSNLFFPMSCIWGMGNVLICVSLRKNRWNNNFYIFFKGMLIGALFEFTCGYAGEVLVGVTFWDYSDRPLHFGKYINLPFCLLWGALSLLWVRRIYPFVDEKLTLFLRKTRRSVSKMFLYFMIVTNLVSGMALLRMHERQQNLAPSNSIEAVLDTAFPDSTMQKFFPKMKDAQTGEKIFEN